MTPIRKQNVHSPQDTMAVPRGKVDLYIDFKSGYSYNCVLPFMTIPRDYNVDVSILPFMARLRKPVETPREEKMRKYKEDDARRYAKLLGFDLKPKGARVDSLPALLGLLWVNAQTPAKALDFTMKVFEAFWLSNEDVSTLESVGFVESVVKASGVDVKGLREFMKDSGPEELEKLRVSSDIFGVPCMVIDGSAQHYLPCNVSIVRYKLHLQGLAKRKDVIPDITCAYRLPEPRISSVIRGMPGTGLSSNWLSRYHERSKSGVSENSSAQPVDVYLDIKSPHAYLAMEMSMALEEDFDVQVNFWPFLLPIAEIFGTATKKKGKEKRQTRNNMQLKQVKSAYANIRDLANMQNKKVLGTPKVYDSAYISIAMLWAIHCGREALDRFLAYTYPIMWDRKLDIEDVGAVKDCLVNSKIPLELPNLGSFDRYLEDGQGRQELTDVSMKADKIGVLGVPSYVLDGEVFWGKEHVSLVRLKLLQKGLKLDRCTAENPVDVPFAWRPYEQPQKTSTL